MFHMAHNLYVYLSKSSLMKVNNDAKTNKKHAAFYAETPATNEKKNKV